MQPVNSTISVFPSVRAKRDNRMADAAAALTKRLRPLIMSVPSEEQVVGVLSRDTTVTDFSPYCGEARHSATRGFPIVVGLLPTKAFSTAQEGLPGCDFAICVGQDKFIRSASDGLTRDLHADLRNDALVANMA